MSLRNFQWAPLFGLDQPCKDSFIEEVDRYIDSAVAVFGRAVGNSLSLQHQFFNDSSF